MIVYDYLIEREINKDKWQKFIPESIPKKLDNLTYIEGPNACGKSTLLNIIALGLFGLKNRRINPALQIKMNSLLSANYQKLTFSFEIVSKNGALRSEKLDSSGLDIIVKESLDGKNYKPLSYEKFEEKYNLIYDIPNNPTERLPELLKELKDEQLQFGNKIYQFSLYLNVVLTEIGNSRNEKKLEETKKKIEDFTKQKEEIEKTVPELELFLNELEKAAYLKYYLQYLAENQGLSENKERIEKEIQSFVDTGQKVTSRISTDKKKISQSQANFIQVFRTITPLIEGLLPKTEKRRFQIWKEINPYSVEMHDLENIVTELLHFRELFTRQLENMERDNTFRDANVLKKVLTALKEFENSPLVIPQLKVTIGELVAILEEENAKSVVLMSKYENLNNALGLLDKLEISVNDMKSRLEDLKQEKTLSKQHSDTVNDYYEKKRQLDNVKRDLNISISKRDNFYLKCCSKGIDKDQLASPSADLFKAAPVNNVVKEYLSLTEQQVLDKINDINRQISNKRNQLPGINVLINQFSRDLRQLENLTAHKYEKEASKIEELQRRTQILSQKILSKYNADLQVLIDSSNNYSEVSEDKLEQDTSKYYNEVYHYLASRIGTFRHVNGLYKAKMVNILSKVIVTEEDDIIRINTMSTGQTISAYLLSLLNIPKSDKRKIIALFDEIAMMDDTSLEPVRQSMKKLFEENRLILGILVQKGNSVNIKAF
jgi:exonuclease SbcC